MKPTGTEDGVAANDRLLAGLVIDSVINTIYDDNWLRSVLPDGSVLVEVSTDEDEEEQA